MVIQKQVHGYRRGHQLLSASIALADRDQDAVDRLSDLTGSLRPGELFDPYLTAYPLPSEEYYVLARTFQDLATARSGCVRTSSVLVPMAAWSGIESLDGVLAELVWPDANSVVVEREVEAARLRPLKRVADGKMAQLIDAVFLDRRPVVFFDCAESEAIAVRLMLALWPAARRRFSLCTFALGPRSLETGFFDLVFAPMSVRSRFVGLGHRRVGGSGRLGYGRDGDYGWAEPAVLRVFRSDEPNLAGLDPLGLLGLEEDGDRTSLRVVSLWNELASRADRNPTAVLGMLDILRSRGAGHQYASWPELEERVLGAIDAAAHVVPVKEAWEVLFALEAKVDGGWASRIVQERLGAGARRLAGRESRGALVALMENPSRRLASRHVAKGLADGVAESLEFTHLIQDVRRLPAVAVAQLMASSARFARGVVKGMNANESQWMEVFWDAFDSSDEDGKRGIRRETLAVLEGHVVEQTIRRLLEDLTGEELAELARQAIGRVPASTTLNGALWDAARMAGGEATVRDSVMESSEEMEAEQFVLPTLVLNRRDVEWLVGRTGDERRTSRLLRALLGTVADEEIKALSLGPARDVLALLGAKLEACKREIVRVLALDVNREGAALDLGFRTLSVLRCEETRFELGKWLLCAVLSDAGPEDGRVSGVLGEFGSGLTALDLVEAATASKASAGRIRANLVALDGSQPDVRSGALCGVERLSERLVDRPEADLGGEGYTAWASMIRDSLQEAGTEVQLRVARSVLRFALRLAKRSVSALIVETFPIVYEHLPNKGGKYRNREGLGSLLTPYYLWWLGVNEGKDDRKQAVSELLRAFMSSTWAPADLVVTALRVGLEKKVVSQIRRRAGGMRYIEDIRQDARRLRKGVRTRVLKCLEVGR